MCLNVWLGLRVWTLRKKKIIVKSDLQEFLRDVHVHGYGLVRVDPDEVFQRSPREMLR